jgi:hypothetical protein
MYRGGLLTPVVKHIISLLQALNLQISLNQAAFTEKEISEPQVLKWRGCGFEYAKN